MTNFIVTTEDLYKYLCDMKSGKNLQQTTPYINQIGVIYNITNIFLIIAKFFKYLHIFRTF